jgi:hypothetical protein
VKQDSFKIPLTQEIFADALGLSVVHINRTLKELRQDGAVVIKMGLVKLADRQRLAASAYYHPPGADLSEPGFGPSEASARGFASPPSARTFAA